MSGDARLRRSGRWWSWAIGAAVLLALGVGVAAMLRWGALVPRPLLPEAGAGTAPRIEVPALRVQGDLTQGTQSRDGGTTVRGVVRLPNGAPAAAATVTVCRALSAWPEWRCERLDQAITGRDGTFQFPLGDVTGLLVGFEHTQFVGDLVEVPRHGELDLRLAPAFELSGVVTTDSGAPIAAARVALESLPGEQRRVDVCTTTADGRYSFKNQGAGPVRVVARHEAWQPVAYPAIVVGDQRQVDLRFERPAMSPLRGRVTSAATQAPIAGALVQLLPVNGKLGLVDPVEVLTGNDGTFLLSGLARGNMRLFVRHAEHGAVMRTQTVGTVATELPIELPMRSTVSGQLVIGESPEVFPGDELLQIQDSSGQVEHTVIGADGRFRFGASLSPGWARLRLIEPRFAFFRSKAAETDVRIEEGASTAFELEVVPPAIVRGRLVDGQGRPLASAQLVRTRFLPDSARTIGDAAFQLDLGAVGSQVAQLVGAARDEPLATSGKDGSFTIRGLAPGPLLLRTVAPGHGSRLLRAGVIGPFKPVDVGDVVLPRGCRLQGRVQRSGRALAGATVVVHGRDTQASAITDAGGSWSVDDLVPGEYRVRARLPSQPAGSEAHAVRVVADGPPMNLLIVVDAGRAVRGIVTGSDGQPVAGAIVAVRGAIGQTTASDGNGEFVLEVPERAVELQVSLADRSTSRIVAVPPVGQRVDVRLDTPPTCTITALVAGLPGRTRMTSALLRLTPLFSEEEGETRSRWVELPDGELAWPLCPAGRVRIEIWCDGFAPFVVERELAANEKHALGEVLLEPGSRLDGVVRDDRGNAVANARVLLGEESDLDLFDAKTRTGADGVFRLSGVTHRSTRLVARAAGFAARVVELELPRDVLSRSPLVVTLERGSTIELSVAGELAGEGALVQLRRGDSVVASAELDDNGRAWFANRSAGEYTVQLVGSDAPPKALAVVAGSAQVKVALP